MRMHRSKAFTLIEVMVVVVIIGILASVSILGYNSIQKNARDSSRWAKASVIAESLERYYDQNNEYPSVASLANQPVDTVKQKLSIQDGDVLVFPTGAPTTTSISTGTPSSSKLVYNGTTQSSSTTTQCQTSATGYCDSFQLQYLKETDNSPVVITSRQTPTGTADCSLSECLSPPTKPTVVGAAISTPAVRFTASGSTCAAGSVQYKVRYNTTSASVSAMPNWDTVDWLPATTRDVEYPAGPTTYYSQSLAQCVQGSSASAPSAESDVHTLTVTPFAAPTGLTTTVVISGSNAVATYGGGNCAPGATLQRQTQYATDYYLFGGSWSGLVDYASTTQSRPVNEGWQMTYHQQARCVNTSAGLISAWTWGPQASATRPISTLGAPSVSVAGSSSNVAFSWGGAACPTGTTKEYQFQQSSQGGNSGWWGPTWGTTFDWADSSQGYTFSLFVQQRCTNSYTTGAWSGSGSAGYARPVDTPGAAHSFSAPFLAGSNRSLLEFKWSPPACGPATGGQWRLDFTNGGGPGIRWLNSPTGREDGWFYGANNYVISGANPSTGWTDAWYNSYGYLGHDTNPYVTKPPRMNIDHANPGAFDNLNIMGIAVQFRCVNSATGVASGPGPVSGDIKYIN